MAMSQISQEPHNLAKYGISLVINNHTKEAEELFKSNLENIQMNAGYAFVCCMDAIMSFEDDKLEVALNILRDIEKRCATDVGWLKSVKNKVWGTKSQSLCDRLETQIILADSQVCIATLTFLQHDVTAFLKGGWILRKAWKIYQHTYLEISEIYRQKFGSFNLPEPTDFDWTDNETICRSSSCVSSSGTQEDWTIPDSPPSSKRNSDNGYGPISSPIHKSNIPHSQSTFIFSKSPNFFPFSIKRSGSAHSSLTANHTKNNNSTFSLLSPLTTHLSFLTNSLNLLSSSDNNTSNDIDPEIITRLMGAVCFGYGLLELGMSLLPSSILKVTNFFGFNGNRNTGVSNLMYARKGTDMRAPLATLALLWYHTIVRPFYALDGNNVKAGLEAASLLIQESEVEYKDSALFLFFKGRIHRLDSNIDKALESFKAAANNTSHRELQLLALHDVGWCYLLKLDFIQAQKVFSKLKNGSRWSKNFYAYITIICSGSFGIREFNEIKDFRNIYQNYHKSNQLDDFIQRRLKIFPDNIEEFQNTANMFWVFLVYELIFLWNALPSCSSPNLQNIVKDCNKIDSESMPGLAKLIQGECYTLLGSFQKAIDSFRECILRRSTLPAKDDGHISAYAEYSLGVLLLKNPETMKEGKKILENCHNYKNYDFENKLHVRINTALKNTS